MLITVDNQSALRLLRIYGINTPVADERLVLQHDGDAGSSFTIDGILDAESNPSIRLKISGHRASRACPLTESDAESLVAEFHTERALEADTQADRTIVQLLMKCSKLYQDSGISELHLVMYLTPQGYRTHAVYMLRARSVSIRRKLAPGTRPRPAFTEPSRKP
ncbi:MAG TPA: hypothetical protein VJP85_00510 [Candidatus Baltobacteraceae bacterium]|nr:hypothetical protein [Candidatus Baltobacteraceae bacterium]